MGTGFEHLISGNLKIAEICLLNRWDEAIEKYLRWIRKQLALTIVSKTKRKPTWWNLNNNLRDPETFWRILKST